MPLQVAALAKAADQQMGHFNAQHLANTAWAFAKMGQKESSLFAASAIATVRHMGDFNPQALGADGGIRPRA